ncbi:MAG: RDD family protein [Bacteroidetes bacterium]|nr:MAG: RDD family protein [Bacteroidota bacterium]
MTTSTPQTDYLSDISDLPNFGYTLASRGERFGAVLLEGIIIYLPLYLILGNNSLLYSDDVFDLSSLLSQTALAAALGAIFYSLWSGNLGHKLLGLKVISSVDGSDQKKPAIGALREALKSFLGVLLIPSIWLLWDPNKQNLYDKIVKTIVVKKH